MSLPFHCAIVFFPSHLALTALTATLITNGIGAVNRVTAMSPVGVLLTSIVETPCDTDALDTTEVAHRIKPVSSDVGASFLAHQDFPVTL
jgi:hypothetical protein